MGKTGKLHLMLALGGACVLAGLIGAVSTFSAQTSSGGTSRLDDLRRWFAGDAAPRSAWHAGQQRYFEVQFQTSVTSNDEELLQVSMTGSWSLLKLAEATPGQEPMRLLGRLEPQQVVLQPAHEETGALRKALTEPVLVEWSERGQVRRIAFAEDSDVAPIRNTARGLLRMLLVGTQLAPPPGDAKRWQSQETDFTGRYVASYQQLSDSGIEKTKIRYLDVLGSGPIGMFTEVETSRALFEFAQEPFSLSLLRSVDWTESTRVTGDGPFPTMRSEVALKLAYRRSSDATRDELVRLQDLLKAASWRALSDKSLENEVALSAAKMSGPAVDELLGTLERPKAEPGDTAQQAQAYARLIAHVRHDEEAFEKVASWLEQPGDRRDLAIDLLGSAGTESAQSLLRTAVENRDFSVNERLHVVRALSLLEVPSEATVDYLAELRAKPDVGRQASYGYGVAAYKLRDKRPDISLDIVRRLIAELQRAPDPETTILLIRALGNAAHPDSLPALAPFLRHENVAVRVAAVDALRRIPGGVADRNLAEVLSRKDVEQVHLAALRTLNYRSATPVLVYAVRDIILTATHKSVLKEALRAGRRWAHEAPVLVQALETIATSTSDPEVRRLASMAG